MTFYTKCLLVFIITAFPAGTMAQQPGWHIQNYNSETGVTNSVKGMEIDRAGYLWMASENGLVRFDGRSFTLYNNANTPVLKNNRLMRVGLFKDSSIFAEDAFNILYAFTARPGMLNIIPESDIKEELLYPGGFNTYIYNTYDRCIAKYNRQLIPAGVLPDHRLLTRSVQNSMVYKEGKLFYFNNKRQLFCADTALTSFQQFTFTGELRHKISAPGTETAQVSLLGSGNDIFLRWDDMIYRLLISNTGKTVTGQPVLKVDSIPNITCYKALPDAGIAFVGTMSNGLYVFKRQYFSTVTLQDKEANIFYAQQPYSDNGVLMKKGVLLPGRFIPFEPGYISECVLKTRDGYYYLEKITPFNGSVIDVYNNHAEKINSIPAQNLHIRCFQQLQDGTIWFSAREGLGEIKNGAVELRPVPKGLPGAFVISTFIELGKEMFLAGGEKGLLLIDLSKNTAAVFQNLNGVNVRCLYTGSKGVTFIGTYGKGYYALYRNKIIKLPLDANNYLANAHAFLEDRNGYVWISTNNGLFRLLLQDILDYLDRQTRSLYFYYYDYTAGFLTNEFNGGCVPAGIVLANGKFSLPSMKGLVQFYPDSLTPWLPVSKIYVDAMIADTGFIFPGNEIKISHNIRRLRFAVSSPYFGNSYNQNIEYRLTGFDEKWYPVNINNIIEFSKLAAGNYAFQLRKKTGFGKDNYVTQAVSFEVEPAFYQTLLFRIVALCCIVCLLYLFYYLRIRYLILKKKTLEKEVFERTKEQHALIDNLETVIADLEQSKEELNQNLAFKEKLVRIISHDIQSPLRFLADIAHKLHERSAGNSLGDVKDLTWQLQKASGNIYHFVEDLALWLTKTGKSFQVHNTWINASSLIQDVLGLFPEQAAAKGNTISTTVEPDLFMCTDRDLFKTILRNIVDNANKNTVNGTISITLIPGEEAVSVAIGDTGNGMYPDVLEKIQHQLSRQPFAYSGNGWSSGFGYMFVTDFCRLLHIDVVIESKTGEGTIVCLNNIRAKKIVNEEHKAYE
ncbi:MAG TPA: ATP-binding protein [Parafilimonas sp.]|nr:ATP-binding protein [Parafilimonas sp.]